MSVEPPQPPAEELDWDAVLAWLPVLRTDGFVAGEIVGGERRADGSFTMPASALSDDARGLVQCLYATGVVSGMDWTTWMQEEGQALDDDRDRLAEATLEQCRMLLTAHVRADRFIEGHLLGALAAGDITAILTRVHELWVGRGSA